MSDEFRTSELGAAADGGVPREPAGEPTVPEAADQSISNDLEAQRETATPSEPKHATESLTATPSEPAPATASVAASADETAVTEETTVTEPVLIASAASNGATLEPTLTEPAEPGATPDLTAVAPRRTSPLRWGIALLVVAVVLAASAIAVAVLSAGSKLSPLTGWAPADTYMYGEVRLDLPGDQRQAVGDLLSRFPGFADQSNIDQKITEALDRAIGNVSNGTESYSAIKPWLGSAIAILARGTPEGSTSSAPALVAVAITDPTAARAWVKSHETDVTSLRTETYSGSEITLFDSGGHPNALAVLDKVILAGDESSVKAAIDTKGAGSFASGSNVKAAVAAVEGSPLGFFYLDLHRVMDAAMTANPAGSAAIGQDLIDKLPAWLVMTVRARSDALQVDTALAAITGAPTVKARTSTLAAHLPATTVAEYEIHDVGQWLKNLLDQYKQLSQTKDVANQIDQVLGTLGGFDSAIGWLGDASVVVTAHDGTIDGGLVAIVNDEKAAGEKLTMLRSLVALAAQSGSGVAPRDEPYGDGTITVIDLGNLSSLAQATGQSLPVPAGARLEIAYTVQRGKLVVGVGDSFVKAVLDSHSGASLADQDRYKQALDRAGASNGGQLYVDVSAILDLAVSKMPADARTKFQQDVQPYVQSLGAIGASGTPGDPIKARVVLTFTK